MKAVVVTAKDRLELVELAIPRPGPYDCLVKIDACAICTGTDSSIIGGTFPWPQPYPFALGHESTGIVIEIGENVRSFQIGQRVTRPAVVLPGQQRDGLGSQWGGYAEYGLVRDVEAPGGPPNAAHAISRKPLPDGIDPISGALSVNQREILSVVRRFELDVRSAVVIIGSGYNGLLFALLCKHFGAGHVVVVGNPVMAERATGRYRADAFIDYHAPNALNQSFAAAPTHVIDAVGSVASVDFARAILAAAPQAAFGCYGVHDFNATAAARQSIAGSHPPLNMSTDEPGTVEEWYGLWQAGFFDGLYDRVMPLAQIHEAFTALAQRRALKIVLEIGS